MLFSEKHNWVTFYNPRNGKVRIQACMKCGVAKNHISGSLECIKAKSNSHPMTKMGWQELPNVA